MNIFKKGEIVRVKLKLESEQEFQDVKIRFGYYDNYERKVASSICVDAGDVTLGENEFELSLNTEGLVEGSYRGELSLFISNDFGSVREIDIIPEAFYFDIEDESDFEWKVMKWGAVRLKDMERRGSQTQQRDDRECS